ncbi:AAA family ATPase [Chloroflexota bacterium]
MTTNNSSTSVLLCQPPPFDWKALQLTLTILKDNNLRYIPLVYGQKKPLLKEWKHLQDIPPTKEELSAFYSGKPVNLGVLCGRASGGLIAFCFNSQEGARELFGDKYSEALEKTFVTRTQRGIHIYFRTNELIKTEFFEKDGIPAWLEIRGDGTYCVFPPSKHPSGGLYQAIGVMAIAKPSNLANWLENRLIELGLRKSSPPPEIKEVKPHWIKEVWGGVPKGSRNTTATKLAGYFRQKLPQDICLLFLREWGARCTPPCSDAGEIVDLEAIVKSVFRYPSKVKPLKITSTLELLSEPEQDIDWIIEGIVTPQSRIVVSGPTKIGKTMLALEMAYEIATGKDFLGIISTPRAARVLFLELEVGKSPLKSRLRKLAGIFGNADIPMVRSSSFLPLNTPEGKEELERIIQETTPEVVFLDPLIKFHISDEDKASAMQTVFGYLDSLLDEYGVSFIVLQNMRKIGKDASQIDAELVRGSSQLTAWANSILTLKRKPNNPEITLSFTLRDAEDEIPPMILNFERDTCTFSALFKEAEIKVAPETIINIVAQAEGKRMRRAVLRDKIEKETGAVERTIDRVIKVMEKEDKIRLEKSTTGTWREKDIVLADLPEGKIL